MWPDTGAAPSVSGAELCSAIQLMMAACSSSSATSSVGESGPPVIGLVAWFRSQSAITSRSYTCPSDARTGSVMSWRDRPQSACAGGTSSNEVPSCGP
eukprot:3833297-Prymnesium_polylepis.1